MLGTSETILCGGVSGKMMGVSYASSITGGVEVGEMVAGGELCPHAVSRSSKESTNDDRRREEMT